MGLFGNKDKDQFVAALDGLFANIEGNHPESGVEIVNGKMQGSRGSEETRHQR